MPFFFKQMYKYKEEEKERKKNIYLKCPIERNSNHEFQVNFFLSFFETIFFLSKKQITFFYVSYMWCVRLYFTLSIANLLTINLTKLFSVMCCVTFIEYHTERIILYYWFHIEYMT